jgi:RibD C-terminal domain
VRQLHPFPPDPVNPATLYGDLPSAGARPTVRLKMIASIDGATSVAGLSGGLGAWSATRCSRRLVTGRCGARRRHCAGETLRTFCGAHRVVFRSCRLGWDSPFWGGAIARLIVIIVAEAPMPERNKAVDQADVIIACERDLDPATAFGVLAGRGLGAVLAEGGPGLNGELAAADLLDGLCLTLPLHDRLSRSAADARRGRLGRQTGVAAPLSLRAGRVPVPAVPAALAPVTVSRWRAQWRSVSEYSLSGATR